MDNTEKLSEKRPQYRIIENLYRMKRISNLQVNACVINGSISEDEALEILSILE